MTYTAAADAGVRVNGGSPTPYSITADGVTGSGNVGGIAQPGTVTCSGQVKATFAWVPAAGQTVETDPPPSHVIVRETGSASWAGDAGSCADGLGHAATGGPFGQTSAGTFRQLFSIPGVQFETLCFPTASASITAENPSGLDNATVQIAYSVEAFPVWIETTGWQFHQGERKLQTGQRLTAGVKYPAALESTQNTFQWGDPQNGSFADYVIVNGPTEYSADWTDYSPPDTRTTTLFFSGPPVYKAAGTQIEMTCNAVLWLDGESFSLQTKSPKFKLLAPSADHNASPESWGLGKPKFTDNDAPFPEKLTDPLAFHLKGVQCPHEYPPPVGTLYVGVFKRLKVVSPYVHEGAVGQWCYAQTVAPLFHVRQGTNEWHGANPNQWGLDYQWPLIGPYPATDTTFYREFADSPGLTGSEINEMDWLRFKGSFKVWAMYLPPGDPADARWVPVWYQPWLCDGIGEVDSRQGGSTTWRYLTKTAGNGPQLNPPPFPEWQMRHATLSSPDQPGPPP